MCIFEYDQEKHLRMEREEAWADGNEAGAAQKCREIAIRMLEQGFSEAQVAKACGISEEEVKKYREEAKSV